MKRINALLVCALIAVGGLLYFCGCDGVVTYSTSDLAGRWSISLTRSDSSTMVGTIGINASGHVTSWTGNPEFTAYSGVLSVSESGRVTGGFHTSYTNSSGCLEEGQISIDAQFSTDTYVSGEGSYAWSACTNSGTPTHTMILVKL